MSKICCFTGHRNLPPSNSAEMNELKEALRLAMLDALNTGHTHFIAGGATGFDMMASELVLLLKKDFPDLTLTIYVPHPKQDASFSDTDKSRYRHMMEFADKAYMLSDHYYVGCMRDRNQKMVDRSDLCIAYVRKSRSGAAQTMRMAEARGIPVIRI